MYSSLEISWCSVTLNQLGVSLTRTPHLAPRCVPVTAKNAVAPLFFFPFTVRIPIQVLGARGYACACQVTTIAYRAPEMLLGAPTYTGVVDVWSIRCIFAEMVRGKDLFGGHSEMEVLKEILRYHEFCED